MKWSRSNFWKYELYTRTTADEDWKSLDTPFSKFSWFRVSQLKKAFPALYKEVEQIDGEKGAKSTAMQRMQEIGTYDDIWRVPKKLQLTPNAEKRVAAADGNMPIFEHYSNGAL